MANTFDLTVTLKGYVDGVSVTTLTKALSGSSCDEIMGAQYIEIANLTVDEALSLGPLTTAYSLMILSDQVVSVKPNASATAMTLRANEPVVLSNVTALTISNSSGSTAKVQYAAIGT